MDSIPPASCNNTSVCLHSLQLDKKFAKCVAGEDKEGVERFEVAIFHNAHPNSHCILQYSGAPFNILTAVPYSSKGFGVCINSGQFLCQYFNLFTCSTMGQRRLRCTLREKNRTGEDSSWRPLYRTQKPFVAVAKA